MFNTDHTELEWLQIGFKLLSAVSLFIYLVAIFFLTDSPLAWFAFGACSFFWGVFGIIKAMTIVSEKIKHTACCKEEK